MSRYCPMEWGVAVRTPTQSATRSRALQQQIAFDLLHSPPAFQLCRASSLPTRQSQACSITRHTSAQRSQSTASFQLADTNAEREHHYRDGADRYQQSFSPTVALFERGFSSRA